MRFQIRNLLADKSAICFKLRFTRTSGTDAHAAACAGGDSLQVAPHAGQARIRVLHLRELDLKLRFGRASTGRKNIEDELGAIEHFDALADLRADFFVDDFFQAADLARREIVVEQYNVRLVFLGEVRDLDGFAAAEVSA